MVKARNNLIGQTFGRLLVVSQADDYTDNKGRRRAQWNCCCECGNTNIIVVGCSLISGRTKSCGCLNKESVSTRRKKYNQYNLSGEYGVGYTEKNEEFWFDIEDYDLIKDYCWCYNDNGYVVTINPQNGQLLRLHRLVMNATDDVMVDHIKHPERQEHKVDNRKNNLRIVTHSQNTMNSCLRNDNSSGFTGVSWDKHRNKWAAYIAVDGKLIHLGRFISLEDAVCIRREAEQQYFGEYSYNADNVAIK